MALSLNSTNAKLLTILYCILTSFTLFHFRLDHLGILDTSEFSLHIQGSGFPHAPGYPLYTILGKWINTFTKQPFLAQFWISIGSLFIITYSFLKTFELRNQSQIKLSWNSISIALVTILSSFYVKLFTVIPEVFILNLALFSLLIWAIQAWYFSKNATSIFWVILVYGLGLSHHHSLALTLPGFLLLQYWKIPRMSEIKNYSYPLWAAFGLLLGALPLLFLFYASSSSPTRSFHLVSNFSDFLYVLLRRSYGTLKLSNIQDSTDLLQLIGIFFSSVFKNFNYIGTLLFVPGLIWINHFIKSSSNVKDLTRSALSNLKKEPVLVLTLSTVLLFLFFFIPQCNIPIDNKSYHTVFLRFLTIPFFLMCYWIPFSLQVFQEKIKFIPVLFILIASNFVNFKELRYQNFSLLEDHIQKGYETIFADPSIKLSSIFENTYQCVIFAHSDSMLFSVLYYNDNIAPKKCFILYPGLFSGMFHFEPEERLKAKILGEKVTLELNEKLSMDPLQQVQLFMSELEKNNFRLFIFYAPDYKLFFNSPFGYHPYGNILELAAQRNVNSSPEFRSQLFDNYLNFIESYINQMKPGSLPHQIIDHVAHTALFQNLFEYPKFNAFFSEKLPHQDQLMTKIEILKLKVELLIGQP